MQINYEKDSVGSIFRRLFFPTLLGLLFGSIMNVTDGIFVGRGVGSDAIASVNIAAPVFMISTALALMFGTGSTVLASIALSQKRRVDAGLHIRHGLAISLVVCAVMTVLLLLAPDAVARLFGATDSLMPYVRPYLLTIALGVPFYAAMLQGVFIIRMDGSPKFAMLCDMVPSILNIILDYVFIFPLGMGIFGAALASTLCGVIGGVMVIAYLLHGPKRFSMKALGSESESGENAFRMLRNQSVIGFSGFLGEFAVSLMLIMGNFVFGRALGEDGIAAYSIACYCTPLFFMLINATASSSQPIISYDHGRGALDRVAQARNLGLCVAMGCAMLVCVGMWFFTEPLVRLFLGSAESAPYQYAVQGLPLFALCCIPMAFNVVMIVYYQSLERGVRATIYTVLRGYIYLVACFMLVTQHWLAVPCAEVLTMVTIVAVSLISKFVSASGRKASL